MNKRGFFSPLSLGSGTLFSLPANDAEAKSALAEARRLNPQFTIKWFLEAGLPVQPVIVDGLRKAGLPEE